MGSLYLSDLIKLHALSIQGPLSVPRVKKKSAGCRAWSCGAPFHWNDLPADIRQSDSNEVFNPNLKLIIR